MREYEIATVLNMGLEDGDPDALTEKIEGWIVAAGGKVARADNWGRRKLAYPIKKQQEGNYVFWYASLPSAAPAELEQQMRLNEDVLRFMITRAELPVQPEEEDAAEEEQGEGQSVDESGAAGEENADSGADAVESANSEPVSGENVGGDSAVVS